MFRAVVPQVSRRRCRQSLVGLGLAPPAIAVGPGFFGEVGSVGGIAPLVPVFGYFSAAIDVVKDHCLSNQLVPIRRHVLAKERETRIAVSPSKVAKYLVKSPVLPDDVQHVLDLGKDLFLDSVGLSLIHSAF